MNCLHAGFMIYRLKKGPFSLAEGKRSFQLSYERDVVRYMHASVRVLLMSVSQTVSGAAGEMTELSHQAQHSAVNQTLRFTSQGHRRERESESKGAVKDASPCQHIFQKAWVKN